LTATELPETRRAVEPLRFFTAEEIERARRYHRPLYWFAAGDLALEAGILAALVWTEAGKALDPSSLPWWARTLAYGAIVVTVSAGAQAPLAFWRGHVRERRWGFSTQSWREWLADRSKALALNVLLTSPLLLGVVALARALPGWWVVPAAAAAALVALALSFAGPVLIAPLFNRYTPLRAEPLATELRALAEAACVPIEAVLVEDTSRRTRKENAYVTGLGRTRRIVVSDTLLAAASPAELRTVVAHELGHRHKRHVLMGTLLSIGAAIVAAVVVWAVVGTHTADPHRLPLLLLIGLALSLAALPAFTAVSRRWERSADRYAVELTKDPAAYQTALRRLATDNLGDLDPPRLIYLLLFTHPTPAERLTAAG
jgi:STE24 endopeptidase